MLFASLSLVLIFIIINIVLKRIDNKKFLSNNRLSVMDKELKIACNYMEKNFRDPELSVKSICKALVTGPAFLEILFNNELGMGIDDFLTQVRMNRALEIIKKEKNLTIDDLILRIGFTDNNEFFNSFEKITGISFSEFQRSQNLQ
jgi:two-component system response regulator YesN